MKVTVEQVRDNLAKLTIEVSPEEFEAALDKAFEKVVKEVKIDGFRPGKCPKSMFIKRFGYEALYEEGVNFALNDTYPAAVEENKLYVVNQPTIDVDFATLSKENGFTYTATVDVVPACELGEYKGLKVDKVSTRVTAKEVDAKLEEEQKKNARTITVEDRAVQDGDEVIFDFEGFVNGVAFEGGKGENYPLTIGSGSFIPGFEEQLIGAEAEKEVEVNVTFPEEYHSEELAGKEATFKCTVHEIKVKELPELDDDFAAEVSEFDTLEEYKADIKAKIKEQKQAEGNRQKEDQAVEKAVANATMEIPEAMIDTQVGQMVQEFAQRLQSQGLSMEQYFQFTGLTADKMNEEMRPQAVKRIETRLVLEAIAKAENIEISEEKLDAELTKMAEMYQMEVDKLKEYMGESEKEQMKADMAVQEAVTLLVDSAVEE